MSTTWECKTCLLKNDTKLTKCRACESKRDVDPEAEAAARKASLEKLGVKTTSSQKIDLKSLASTSQGAASGGFKFKSFTAPAANTSEASTSSTAPADVTTTTGASSQPPQFKAFKAPTAATTETKTDGTAPAVASAPSFKFKTPTGVAATASASSSSGSGSSLLLGMKRKEMEAKSTKLNAEVVCPIDQAEEQHKAAAAILAKVKPCPVAKDAKGTVMAFGAGEMAQLGMGHQNVTRRFPGAVLGDLNQKDVIQVVTSALHNIALTKDGKVFTWGTNDDGALGRDTESDAKSEYIPTLVAGALKNKRIIQVACGASHSLALADDGTVFSWGSYRDASGLVGFDTEVDREFNPVEVEGLPVSDDDKDTKQDKVICIAAGESHSIACTRKGHVYYWGDVYIGRRLASRFKRARLSPQKVTLNLRRGSPEGMKLKAEDALATKVFAGGYSSFVVSKTGLVWVWGPNNYGQCGLPRPSDDPSDLFVIEPKVIPFFAQRNIRIAQIAAAVQFSIALSDDGRVFGFGRVEDGRLAHGTEKEYQDSHEQPEPLLISKLTPQYLSSEESWSEPPSTEYKGEVDPRTKHAAPDAIVQVSCGESHAVACSARGRLFTWGASDVYQLGTGTEEVQYTPYWVRAGQITQFARAVIGVSAGSQHTLILVKDMAKNVE